MKVERKEKKNVYFGEIKKSEIFYCDDDCIYMKIEETEDPSTKESFNAVDLETGTLSWFYDGDIAILITNYKFIVE